jgi:RND family efflux transporter MFP subunit
MHHQLGPRSVCAVWLLFLSGCGAPKEEQQLTRPVRVMRVQDVAEFEGRWFPGLARATREVNISFRVSGPLMELPVTVGSVVEEGDVLARIDPRDFQIAYRTALAGVSIARAQLRAMQIGARPEELEQLRAAVQLAEARLQTALNDFARSERLIESRAISQAEYDQAYEARIVAEVELRRAREDLQIGEVGARPEDIEAKEAEIRSLEASASTAENQLNDVELRAPFNGVVVARFVDNFEQVRAQQPIFRILDESRIEMIVNLPEGVISLAPYVQNLECVFDSFPDLRIPAEVIEIGREATRSTRTFPVRLGMDQPQGVRILPGMAGRARGNVVLPEAPRKSLEIPESAIFELDGKTMIWIIDSEDGLTGRAGARQVELEGLSARGLRVVQGLSPGELVATAGANRLQEGQIVRILDQPSREPSL